MASGQEAEKGFLEHTFNYFWGFVDGISDGRDLEIYNSRLRPGSVTGTKNLNK
jgi:hypothetical protein